MRAAADHDLAVVPRGLGSRLHWGVPPSRCDPIIDTLAMGQVIEHAAGDLVARVQAGARIGEIAAVLAAAGQEIALDVPPTATIGGVVADALAGPGGCATGRRVTCSSAPRSCAPTASSPARAGRSSRTSPATTSASSSPGRPGPSA